MAITKTEMTLETLEAVLQEAAEAYGQMDRLRHKLLRLKRGSHAYYDVMTELSVAAIVLGAKCQSLDNITDEIIDAMPED
jgi:hypothetical protein